MGVRSRSERSTQRGIRVQCSLHQVWEKKERANGFQLGILHWGTDQEMHDMLQHGRYDTEGTRMELITCAP